MTEINRNGRTVALQDLTPNAPADASVVLLCHAAPGSASFDPDPDVTAAAGSVTDPATTRPPGLRPRRPPRVGSTTDRCGPAGLRRLRPGGGRLRHDRPRGRRRRGGARGRAAGGPHSRVAGWSAGGRVALALAARHPELVGRVAAIAAPAPDEEVPWYGDENRAMVDGLRGLRPAEAVAQLTAMFDGMFEGAGDDALLGLAGVADADTGVLTEAVRDRLRVMFDAATAQGVTGMVADLAGYTLADWGFTPSQVAADVLLAYGRGRRARPARSWRVVPGPVAGCGAGAVAGRRAPRRGAGVGAGPGAPAVIAGARSCGFGLPTRTGRAACRVQR